MKAELIPDKWLRLMSEADRKSLGNVKTLVEVFAKEEAKSERDLHKQIGNLLRLRGIEFIESRMDRKTTQKRGVPDYLFAMNGLAYAWEIKFGDGKLSEEQEAMMKKLTTYPNSWAYRVIRSVDEALTELKALGL